MRLRLLFAGVLAMALGGCDQPWNSPYPATDATANTFYAGFAERPKHLDPVQSYSSNEIAITAQIYTPPLQYHYLDRPYRLVPLAAVSVPRPAYLGADGRLLPDDAPAAAIAYSVYEVTIRDDMRYQPHPAFARRPDGGYRYHDLTPETLAGVYTLSDFRQRDTRPVTAADFVYEIKRLAHPRLHSPILGLMSDTIVGLKDYAQHLREVNAALVRQGRGEEWIDLREHPLEGAEVVDERTFRVRLKGKYPQFVYWLAMPFFAPMPWEAERFHTQPLLASRNITLDWYPVGAGPYMLTRNDPNRQMVLERNPHFHGELYPTEGEATDREDGLLRDAGSRMPFIDRAVYSLEKESIPYWNKFLQGWYDSSGISSDAFDQAVQVGATGHVLLTDEMREKGIRLKTAIAPSTMYMGFNMLDPVVGGQGERGRRLRQAISIAVDYEEFVSIFANGRGVPAQSPIPPGIFGYRDGEAGINPVVYDWVDGGPQRKSIEVARQLLRDAGYPDGRDAVTGAPLVLYLDATARGPDDKARMDWLRKQFARLDVNLVVRATDYNRFQEKIRKGNAQIFYWGWNADYPDPENFLFLLHGPQGKVSGQGENAANYGNAEYDALFERMKNMDNGPERQAIIDRMVRILQEDAPWIWGMHPKEYGLAHGWVGNRKPNQIANNLLKYQRIDTQARAAARHAWNVPVLWPLALVALLLAFLAAPAWLAYRRRESAGAIGAQAGG